MSKTLVWLRHWVDCRTRNKIVTWLRAWCYHGY